MKKKIFVLLLITVLTLCFILTACTNNNENNNTSINDNDKDYFEGLKLAETIQKLAVEGFDLLSYEHYSNTNILYNTLAKDTNQKEILNKITFIFINVNKINNKVCLTYEIAGKKYSNKVNTFRYDDKNTYEFNQIFKGRQESSVDFSTNRIIYAFNNSSETWYSEEFPEGILLSPFLIPKTVNYENFQQYLEEMEQKANISRDMQEINILPSVNAFFVNDITYHDKQTNLANPDLNNNKFVLFIKELKETNITSLTYIQKIIFSFEIIDKSKIKIHTQIIGQHYADNPVEITGEIDGFYKQNMILNNNNNTNKIVFNFGDKTAEITSVTQAK